jgi:hypothetical protein
VGTFKPEVSAAILTVARETLFLDGSG